MALAAHYGEYMLHPVAVTPAMFLISISIVEVSNIQKQSVSNAFQYVVLRPVAPSPSDDITAAWGQMRCKITNFILNLAPEKEKSSKKFGISEKNAYLCKLKGNRFLPLK